MKIQRNTKGFTLVEIMIVVAIIALLASIAVPNFVQARTNTRRGICINNLRLMDSAKQQIAVLENVADGTAFNGTYTTTAAGYFKSGTTPSEPAGGAYTWQIFGSSPTCNQTGHVLPAAAA